MAPPGRTVATPPSPTLPDQDREPLRSSTVYQLQIAVLRCRIAALEAELERERQRRQAVVDRYERLID